MVKPYNHNLPGFITSFSNSVLVLAISPSRKLGFFNQSILSYSSMAEKGNAPSEIDKEQIFGMAEKEMEYRVELFNKLTHTCFNKCIEKRYKEGELNMGENSCIDRCVSKYWQVTNIIGQLLGSGRPPM